MNSHEYEKIIGILLERIIKLEEIKLTYEEMLKPKVSKLKIFIEVFNALSGKERNDVSEQNLFDELIKTDQFTSEEIMTYIHKSIQNGQLYERKAGVLAKA